MELVLLQYYNDLKENLNTEIPLELSTMSQTSLSFEISKLFEHIAAVEGVSDVFLYDVPDIKDVEKQLKNNNKSARVSAYLTIMNNRVPRLNLNARIF